MSQPSQNLVKSVLPEWSEERPLLWYTGAHESDDPQAIYPDFFICIRGRFTVAESRMGFFRNFCFRPIGSISYRPTSTCFRCRLSFS